MPGRVIAIDGPAASGKSSVSRGVAEALGYLFVSSGYFYRALAWGFLRDQTALDSLDAWIAGQSLSLGETSGGLALLLNGENVAMHLSSPEVASMVSPLAAFPAVRQLVNGNLRALAKWNDLVIEGRDIGSVVFPETPYKFYLDASPGERARRRGLEGAVDSVAERDRLDSTRATAPLRIPEGAVVIDTTNLTLDEVIGVVTGHLARLGDFPRISSITR